MLQKELTFIEVDPFNRWRDDSLIRASHVNGEDRWTALRDGGVGKREGT